MTSSWWANKLGGEQPPVRQQPNLPPAAPTQYPQPSSHNVRAGDPTVTIENVAEAAMQWAGGEAMRKETGNCPSCGSHLYFSRANSASTVTTSGTATPPARCYSCGHVDGRPMQGMPS